MSRFVRKCICSAAGQHGARLARFAYVPLCSVLVLAQLVSANLTSVGVAPDHFGEDGAGRGLAVIGQLNFDEAKTEEADDSAPASQLPDLKQVLPAFSLSHPTSPQSQRRRNTCHHGTMLSSTATKRRAEAPPVYPSQHQHGGLFMRVTLANARNARVSATRVSAWLSGAALGRHRKVVQLRTNVSAGLMKGNHCAQRR